MAPSQSTRFIPKCGINPDDFFVKPTPLRQAGLGTAQAVPKNSVEMVELAAIPDQSELADNSSCYVVYQGKGQSELSERDIATLKGNYPELFGGFSDVHKRKRIPAESADWQTVIENPDVYFNEHQAIGNLFRLIMGFWELPRKQLQQT